MLEDVTVPREELADVVSSLEFLLCYVGVLINVFPGNERHGKSRTFFVRATESGSAGGALEI